MKITVERLVSRGIVRFISYELDLSGVRTSVSNFLKIAIIGGFGFFIGISLVLTILKFNIGIAALLGLAVAALYETALYLILELIIDGRKSFVESILPEYLQLTAANIRSGLALDKAMIAAARPEFKYFSNDIYLVGKQVYAGETLQNALTMLGKRYRSLQLQHTIRMIIESLRYGGGMTDMLNQISKDLRSQATIQKEISGQLFMYTIFIAFAALVGAPVLYALTNRMIGVTDSIWSGILAQNPGGLPTTGLSFLRPSPPQITTGEYSAFSMIAVVMITGLGAFIVSVIMSGSLIKGVRLLPPFILIGLAVFYITGIVMGGIFSQIGG